MKKVLAIDDNGDNLLSLKAIFQDVLPDSVFYSALKGKAGIELAASVDPDVILLDILMPGMDGFEVCRQLKQEERLCDIPVIFITAMKENRSNRLKALEVGGEAFLYKPLDEPELIAQIKAMVKIREANRLKRSENIRLTRLVDERSQQLLEKQQETLRLFDELKAEIEVRKATELELRASEEKFRTLFETMPLGSVYQNADGKIISANSAAERILGLTVDQMMGRTSIDPRWKAIHEDGSDFPGETHPASLALKTGKEIQKVVMGVFNSEMENYRWINVAAVPQFKPGESKPYSVYATFDDITDQKLAEDALKESEQRYRLLFDNSLDAILLTAPNGNIVSVNQATCEMFGRSQEEICRLGRSGIIDISGPELNLALEERARTGKFFGELTGLRSDGTKFPIEGSSTIFTDQNGELRTSMILHDITERKKTEKLLIESEATARAIMEATDDVLILMNKEGIVIDCNEAHAQRFETTRAELLGKNVFNLLPPEIAALRHNLINEVISSGKPVSSEDFRAGYYNEFSIYPIFIQNEITDTVAVFARDITERKKIEEALKENEARLREALATKDKFFSIIAHDLKNPFNSIIGFSDLLVEQVGEKNYDGIEEYSAIIRNSSQRVMDLLMNLLEWSRSQTGRMEFNPEFVNLVTIIHQVRELLDDAARQKGINIELQVSRNVPVIVDKSMIYTVLRNIVSNALKFTAKGGAITVSVVQHPKEWTVSVADYGVGIKKGLIDNLFRIEKSQSTPGTNNEKGTGLGLILCKEFIEKHGGKIWVESEVGKGSTFYFSIPKN